MTGLFLCHLFKSEQGPYEEYVKLCLNKTYPPETRLYVHHIIPRFVFRNRPGLTKLETDPRNLISVSYEDHVELHRRRWLQYKQKGDQNAYGAMLGDEAAWLEIRVQGGRAVQEVLRRTQQCMHSQDFQREMARRSMEKPDARETRSRGGQIGGVNRNANRAITPQEKYVFSFKGDELFGIIYCKTGGEVVEELNKWRQTPLKRATPLLKGERQSLYGWSCRKISMTISSEADKGQSQD